MVVGSSATTVPGQFLTGNGTVGLAWDPDGSSTGPQDLVVVDLCYQDLTEGGDPTIIPFNGSYPPTGLIASPLPQTPPRLPYITIVAVSGTIDPGAPVQTTWTVGLCVKNTSTKVLQAYSTNGWFVISN
jgi:hypothetical protein